jgi:hypothetical protein
MILARADLVPEFFPFPDLDPATGSFGSCLRLDDLDTFYYSCVAVGIPRHNVSGHGCMRPR